MVSSNSISKFSNYVIVWSLMSFAVIVTGCSSHQPPTQPASSAATASAQADAVTTAPTTAPMIVTSGILIVPAIPSTTTQAMSKLVIVKALYGDLPDGMKADVTKIISDAVKDDAVTIDVSNDTMGGDPAQTITKKLTVNYLFNGVPKSKSAAEYETLTISNTGE